MGSFVHLHVHSEYSLLDGLIRIPDLIEKIKSFGMSSVALTDHGVMYGTYEFWLQCKTAGIKPILGVEAYVAPRTRFDKIPKIDDKRYHLILLARNLEGYKNLLKIVSSSHLEGFYYRPRIDKELISKYGKGLIGLSACLQGVVNKDLYAKQEKTAQEWAIFLKKSLDKFYIEIQRNGVKEAEKLVPKQLRFAEKFELPVVATCDAHYLNKDDWYAQEVLWAINDGKKMHDDTRRKAWSKEFYIKSADEIEKLYKDIPEVVENTKKIVDMIEDFDITFERVQPRYPKLQKGQNSRSLLKEMAFVGAVKRYGEITGDIKQRIDYELDLIHTKGYDDYFLVVQDYVNWALDKGIFIGPGRGSGAGSVVAYCLKITNLDPFKFELYFERFLNPERPSPPDFDIDFQDDRRDELFEYMTKVYGKENTSFIGTFGRMKTRAAIRDVARVLDIDLEIADRLSKMVTVKFGKVTHMADMLENDPKFKQIIESDPQLVKLGNIVQKVEGIARHVSTHACGYLVTPKPIVNYLALQKEGGGGDRIMTQIEGSSLEDIGLMKFDFLGLANLTILQNTLELIKKFQKVEIDIDEIPLDDKKTYKLFQNAETTAIFQFESEGMKKYLKELKPDEFEDLIFLAAAYRPGPIKHIPDYIERKFKRQKVTYLHKKLEPILKNTYGIAIYQEQILKIPVEMAGYSLGEADILRRAIGKKKADIMRSEKKKFIQGCIAEGHSRSLAENLFSYIEPFADYGFNRSHSASYALIAYQSAYLKTHFPVEFLAGLMQADLGDSDKVLRDLLEAERMKIKILPPSINKSDVGFTIEGQTQREIRFGLAAIKNVGKVIVARIVRERIKAGDFHTLDELIERVGSTNLNKKTLECLIKAGTMDQFGKRQALLEIMPQIIDRVAKFTRKSQGGQAGLFNTAGSVKQSISTPLPQVEEASDEQKIAWEKELIGIYLTTHPLKKYEKYFGKKIMRISDVKKLKNNTAIKVGGIITSKKEIRTRKGNHLMAFIKIESRQDNIEGVIFNRIYKDCKEKLKTDTPFVFIGKISVRENKVSIIVNEMHLFSYFVSLTLDKDSSIVLDISQEDDPVRLRILKQTILENPGICRVELFYKDRGGSKRKKRLKRKINLTDTVRSVIDRYVVK